MPGIRTTTTLLAGALLFAGCEKSPAPTTPDATSSATTQAEPAIGPRFTLLDPEVNFGIVDDFESRTAQVRFTNSGDGPLEIKRILPTCGCTTVKLETRTFAPGEGDAITLNFDPRGAGEQVKYVKIHTSDPDTPVTNLPIRSNVRITVDAAPRTFQLGDIPYRKLFETTSILTARNPAFVPTSVSITGDLKRFATATITEVTSEGDQLRTWRIDLRINETLPWGWHTGTAVVRGTVKTPERIYPHTFSMGMTCSAQGTIQADDSMFRLLVVNPGRSITRTITLTRADGQPFKVTRTGLLDGSTANTLTSSATPVNRDETAWAITLSGRIPNRIGVMKGSVLVHTDVPGEEVIPLPYSANVQSPR